MRPRLRRMLLLMPLAAAGAGCGEPARDEAAGLTADEERRLDEAAARLDRQRENFEAELAAQARQDAAAAAAAGGEPEAGESAQTP